MYVCGEFILSVYVYVLGVCLQVLHVHGHCVLQVCEMNGVYINMYMYPFVYDMFVVYIYM